MNDTRRKKIESIISKIADITQELTEVKEEEDDYYNNMPESFQSGAKGEKASEDVSTMDDIIMELETAQNTLQEIIDHRN